MCTTIWLRSTPRYATTGGTYIPVITETKWSAHRKFRSRGDHSQEVDTETRPPLRGPPLGARETIETSGCTMTFTVNPVISFRPAHKPKNNPVTS